MASHPITQDSSSPGEIPLLAVLSAGSQLGDEMAAALAGRGFRILGASGLAELEALLGSKRPGMVLVDLEMPSGEGPEICADLRRRERFRQLPVLAVGSCSDQKSIGLACRAGASDFIARPFESEQLTHKVEFLLQSARQREEYHLFRARLAHLQHIAGLGTWEWHPESDTHWWSPEVFRIFGLEDGRAEPSPSTFRSILHPADRTKVDSAFRRTLEQRIPLDLEFRIIRPDGRLRFLHSQGELTSLGAGRPTIFFGTLQDISDRRESENSLRLLKAAIDCLPVGITITDTDGRILFTNPAEARIHGYTVEELLNREARQLAPPDKRAPMKLESLNKIGLWRREAINLRKGGEEFPVQLCSLAVRNAEGDFLGVITTCEDVTERKAAEDAIRQLAYTDTLTGLPNRWMFQDRLNKALAVAEREGGQVGVMFLDLDHFKDVNDTLGHEFGDRLLRAVAQRLAASTREADTLARLGGDEFVVVLTHLESPAGVRPVAERILQAFQRPFDLDGKQIYSGASIGIALFPEDGTSVTGLLKSADTAMYHAKEKGRHTYRFFSPEMDQSIRRKVALETGLRRALEEREFRLVYHPQWDLATGSLIGFEALVRWESPEFGMVRPGGFIALAESAGLIHPIGEWILRNVCLQAADWSAAGLPVPRVAVNISGHQLKRPGFTDQVDAVLRETGFPPGCLELEFTEGVLMEEAERTTSTLKALKERGLQLSIDDFGTGYSSLSHLRHLPIDRIKIDRSLVSGLGTGPDGAAIVEAVIAMGRSLKLKVLAIGVENIGQFDYLSQRGCDEAQGFFFSHPLLPAQVEALLDGARRAQKPLTFDTLAGAEKAELIPTKDAGHRSR